MPNTALRLSAFIRTAFTPSTSEPVIRKRTTQRRGDDQREDEGEVRAEAVLEVDVSGGIAGDAEVERRSQSAHVMHELSAGCAVGRRRRRDVDAARAGARPAGRRDRRHVGECADPRGEGGHLARAGRGADHDFERRGAAGREVACAVPRRRDSALALRGELAGVGGQELDRRERHPERDQRRCGEQRDPARARDHEP